MLDRTDQKIILLIPDFDYLEGEDEKIKSLVYCSQYGDIEEFFIEDIAYIGLNVEKYSYIAKIFLKNGD